MKSMQLALGTLLALSGYTTLNAVSMVNTSPFYLNLVTASGTCPAQIAPGATASFSGYCGYDACSTGVFNDPNAQGCDEVQNGHVENSPQVQGGYSTYFGISAYSNSNPPTCGVAPFIYYACGFTPGKQLGTYNFSLNYNSITQLYSDTNQPVTIPAVSHYASGPIFRGVNISGLEYDGTFLDALFQHPDLPDVAYFAAQGMNSVRLPIRAEFVIANSTNPIESNDPNVNDANISVNQMYLGSVYDTVQKYLKAGISVDLDLHNYMRFCPTGVKVGQGNEPTSPVTNNCSVLTADQLAGIWTVILNTPLTVPGISGTVTLAALAKQYASHGDSSYGGTQLMFGVMNEPFTEDYPNTPKQIVETTDVFNDEVAAVKAIRLAAPDNLILLSGNYWDPLHAWLQADPNDPNNQIDGDIFTAANLQANGIDTTNIAVEVHQYFNSTYSGTDPVCNHYNSLADFDKDMGFTDSAGTPIFANWIEANHMKVLLTEFGASDDKGGTGDCIQDMNWMLQDISQAKSSNAVAYAYDPANPQNGGFIGWFAWRANRHGTSAAFSPFNFLQAAESNVYGGTGILQGEGNPLMADVFANDLTPPASGASTK